jgi:NADH:ubiquinone oxidoreductase subunit 3 (subunit A)
MTALIITLIFIPILVAILLVLNLLLAPHRPDSEKTTAYECGYSPIFGQTRTPFSIQYYLVGILFMVFDLEILLLFPLRLTLYNVSFYGFTMAMIFFIVLTLGFVYEISCGRLYFTDQRSAINRRTISAPKNSHIYFTYLNSFIILIIVIILYYYINLYDKNIIIINLLPEFSL